MKKVWFLDLEGTVISDWFDPVLTNVSVVKEILANNKVESVVIFSFAVTNMRDIHHFNTTMKSWLEGVLGVSITEVISVEQMSSQIEKHTGVVWAANELVTDLGKTNVFRMFCESQFNNKHCVLVDDMVPDSVLTNHSNSLFIETIKV